jgi:hypothetical protein
MSINWRKIIRVAEKAFDNIIKILRKTCNKTIYENQQQMLPELAKHPHYFC